MRNVLFILGQLNDHDIGWMSRTGKRRQLEPGTPLIREGEPLEDIFIVLDGHLSVSVGDGQVVAEVGAGEVLGEMSLIDAMPPSATVTARDEARVLAIDKQLLNERLDSDDGFAARIYRALAMFLSDRLRRSQSAKPVSRGTLEDDGTLEDELDLNVLDAVSRAGENFNDILRKLR